MNHLNSVLAEAKDRLRIPELWLIVGLAGSPPEKGCCCSPFRPDKHPSFSIYDEGRRWKDQATGEGGDGIDFLAMAEGRERGDAIRRFLEIAGMMPDELEPAREKTESATFPNVSILRRPTDDEVDKIARLRRLNPDAVQRAANFGVLRAGVYRGRNVWALVDGPRGERPRLAEVRTFDGTPIPTRDCPEGVKSFTLPGSKKDWPIGASLLDLPGKWRAVLLCEGMPDFLAAFHFAHLAGRPDLCPVAMLGRTNQYLHRDAVALLTGRRIRAYPHADGDRGGRVAMERWASLIPGALADQFTLEGLRRRDGKPVNDLNDAAVIDPEYAGQLQELLP